jgi:hypothetical protein
MGPRFDGFALGIACRNSFFTYPYMVHHVMAFNNKQSLFVTNNNACDVLNFIRQKVDQFFFPIARVEPFLKAMIVFKSFRTAYRR